MNRFWNVAAGGAIVVTVTVIGGAISGLYFGKIDGQMFATITMPLATAWIGAMAALLPKE